MEEKKPCLKVELTKGQIQLMSNAIHRELLHVSDAVSDAESNCSYYKLIADELRDRKFSREMQGMPHGDIDARVKDILCLAMNYSMEAKNLREDVAELEALADYMDEFLDEEQRHG